MIVPPFVIGGRDFFPRGINLGSWLNIEDFMLGTPGTEWQVLRAWERIGGAGEARDWHEAYLNAFLTEADWQFLAGAGFNCVRLPVHWRRLESAGAPGVWLEDGMRRIQEAFDAAHRHGLLVLLDLHVAPGGQNTTPPADNTWGAPLLWAEAVFQDRVVAMWGELARRFGEHPALMGFNPLNEPQVDQYGPLDPAGQAKAMNALHARVIAEIRRVCPEVWVVLDAPLPRELTSEFLDRAHFDDPRVAWSFHHYPLANWEGGINTESIRPDGSPDLEQFLSDRLADLIGFAQEIGRPVLLGEFGMHPDWGPRETSLEVLRAQVKLCRDLGFGWMLWSYKDIGRMGLVNPRPDTPWRRWVERPEWQDLVAREIRASGAFTQSSEAWLPYEARSNRVRDFAFGLHRIAVNSLLHHRFFDDLAAAFSPAERVAMAESFCFANCQVNEDCLAVFRALPTSPE